MTQTITERLHIVEGIDWKEAVIALLEPNSPYRPWRHGFGEAHAGDPVAVVLNTDPVSVMTEVARIGDDGNPGCAVVDMPFWGSELLDLTGLAMLLDLRRVLTAWRLDGDAAVKMSLALSECRYPSEPRNRFGHTSLAAARTLLQSGGACDGCDDDIDFGVADAKKQVHVHTVDPYCRPAPTPTIVPRTGGSKYPPPIPCTPPFRFGAADWPAVLCRHCHRRMNAGGFRRFLDFKFEQHPCCPRCGNRRSLSIFYGMASDPSNLSPWLHIGGCCVSEEAWHCSFCRHEW